MAACYASRLLSRLVRMHRASAAAVPRTPTVAVPRARAPTAEAAPRPENSELNGDRAPGGGLVPGSGRGSPGSRAASGEPGAAAGGGLGRWAVDRSGGGGGGERETGGRRSTAEGSLVFSHICCSGLGVLKQPSFWDRGSTGIELRRC
ncbi:hypothetical protein BS78_10G249800 [Paspalum vaginatum]|nr:hypothetical protein BS78_10G249800 [Paspalum vaginatum]